MRLGVIADDFTGATDIAGFLVENGLRTVQLNGLQHRELSIDADAVVISLKSRSNAANVAVSDSVAALNWLRERNCQQYFFKYCSTFDSTAKGNIGPVTDALLHTLKEDFTIVCPALPVNGRTIYHGYLFVNGVPLNESGMRDHPVTPMKDANLMRLMDAQSEGKTGNVPIGVVEKGAAAIQLALSGLKKSGFRYAVLDALTDDHLTAIGKAVSEMRFVTGGSGLAEGIGRSITQKPIASAHYEAIPSSGRAVVLSGSCSQMTNLQVASYQKLAPSNSISVERCLLECETYVGELVEWVKAQPPHGPAPLLSATTNPLQLKETQRRFGAVESSAAIEKVLSEVASRLADEGFDRFIVAGGETSGAVTQALGITGFYIGPQICPGVPWVRAIDKSIFLALKSGNFGQESFFTEAQRL
ncbi:four-carbon acid sugar kinase family protein (plasmid) [Agrobacterium leguminum]|uniref:3-oxo-tetronate kinase n=1 Tax=Agrobacterium leguminum TaxID=2792015 RepID=UPI00272CB7AC|nr:3-oxo-tetronate kinase [Agrobacterium leguminum]WLE00780.1 four-carbon acid sugar kinase family protein [Agrobacterium leguminum]